MLYLGEKYRKKNERKEQKKEEEEEEEKVNKKERKKESWNKTKEQKSLKCCEKRIQKI